MSINNTNYKIEPRFLHKTLSIIRECGTENAISMAYDRALQVVNRDPESILCVILLAWSYNLLTDARRSERSHEKEDLMTIASFYRRIAHKVYWYQVESGQISELEDFVRKVS